MKKRMILFTLITFALTYPLVLLFGARATTIVFSLAMLMPTAGNFLTRLVTKQGLEDLYLHPRIKGNIKYYLAGLLGPSVLIVLGAAIYFLIFPSKFDPEMTQLVALAQSQGMTDPGQIKLLAFLQLLLGAFLGGFINLPFTLGEELGWRGYLFPGLCKIFTPRIAILISGVIWGLWHAPMIALGHNYGLDYPSYPWGGIGAMVLFCVFIGSFFSFLTYKTKSVWPAALGHGALNAMAAAPVYFTKGVTSPFVGPLSTGIIGGVGFILVGILCFVCIKKSENPAVSRGLEE